MGAFYMIYATMRRNRRVKMATFTPITTQEEFDQRIQERLARQAETLAKKYEGHDQIKAELESLRKEKVAYQENTDKWQKEKSGLEESIKELTSKNQKYELEKTRTAIAIEAGLDYNMASHLTGSDEAEIKASAEFWAGQLKAKSVPPLGSSEDGASGYGKGADSITAGMQAVISDIFGGE